MKLKKSWVGLLSLVAIVAVGCAAGAGNSVSEESLGLRKTDLYNEDTVTPPPVKYTDAAPGTSKRFDRSYKNAPPLIP
ncbi:MAG: nitrate reductase cytochrome c-type subunit; periplasmic nitrate reductase electron transfer subunit, partial [Sulfurospirillum sp.]